MTMKLYMPLYMSNSGYGYGDTYSYGYDYNGQNPSTNGSSYNYGGYGQNFSSQSHNSPYSGAAASPQQSQQNPHSAASSLLNNPAAQIGMQFGTQALSAGQEYVNSNLNRWVSMSLLREYFNVTNSFVFFKLAAIFFPFTHKNWQRNLKINPNTGSAEGFMPPRDDRNSTDLYIPIMALVSYIILVGLIMGVNNSFHPEVLGMNATSCIMALVIEVVLIKLGCFLLGIGSEIHFLDFFSYCGYKFCILIAASSASIFGKTVKYVVLCYCLLAYGFFLIRSLRPMFVPENANALILNQRRKRINYLLGVVGLELIVSYLLLK